MCDGCNNLRLCRPDTFQFQIQLWIWTQYCLVEIILWYKIILAKYTHAHIHTHINRLKRKGKVREPASNIDDISVIPKKLITDIIVLEQNEKRFEELTQSNIISPDNISNEQENGENQMI